VASQLYKAGITRPWTPHLQPCHYNAHVSHINYKFLKYCEQNDIIVFCLPAHSTHLLQPLAVVHFSALQIAYTKAVEDCFCLTSIGINRDIFFPLYKQARKQAYTLHNIHQAFAATGIQPFNPLSVLANAKERAALKKAAENEALLGVELEKIPYTKCEPRHQANQALQFRFSKTATSTTLCDLILHFSHTAEYHMTEADIARTESHNVRKEIKKVRYSKKDMRLLARGNSRRSYDWRRDFTGHEGA